MPYTDREMMQGLGGDQGIGTGFLNFGQGLFGQGTPGTYEDALLTGMRANKLKYDAAKAIEDAATAGIERVAKEGIPEAFRQMGLTGDVGTGAATLAQASGGNFNQMMLGYNQAAAIPVRNRMNFWSGAQGDHPITQEQYLLGGATPQNYTDESGGMFFNPKGQPSEDANQFKTPKGVSDIGLNDARVRKLEAERQAVEHKRLHPTVSAKAGSLTPEEQEYLDGARELLQERVNGKPKYTPKQIRDYLDDNGMPKIADMIYKERKAAGSDTAVDEDEDLDKVLKSMGIKTEAAEEGEADADESGAGEVPELGAAVAKQPSAFIGSQQEGPYEDPSKQFSPVTDQAEADRVREFALDVVNNQQGDPEIVKRIMKEIFNLDIEFTSAAPPKGTPAKPVRKTKGPGKQSRGSLYKGNQRGP